MQLLVTTFWPVGLAFLANLLVILRSLNRSKDLETTPNKVVTGVLYFMKFVVLNSVSLSTIFLNIGFLNPFFLKVEEFAPKIVLFIIQVIYLSIFQMLITFPSYKIGEKVTKYLKTRPLGSKKTKVKRYSKFGVEFVSNFMGMVAAGFSIGTFTMILLPVFIIGAFFIYVFISTMVYRLG